MAQGLLQMTTCATLRANIEQAKGARATLLQQLAANGTQLAAAERNWRRFEGARILGTRLTSETRERVSSMFSAIGTAALEATFGPAASFSVEFDESTDAKIRRATLVASDGIVSGDPTEKSGNSVSSVLSTLLRMAVIIIHPRLRNLLVADEPLYGIDPSRHGVVVAVHKDLVQGHGLQEIIISHDAADELADAADVVIEVSRADERAPSRVKVTRKRECEEF
jgi:hypothetical protein